jgi:hypothetical protein
MKQKFMSSYFLASSYFYKMSNMTQCTLRSEYMHAHTLITFFQDAEPGFYKVALSIVAVLTLFWAVTRFLAVDVLPGVPQVCGYPLLGSTPEHFKYGMPRLMESLIAVGGEGISYAKCLNVTLVSIHNPAIVKRILALPEDDASRYCRTSRV